jgi:hypothetical protein
VAEPKAAAEAPPEPLNLAPVARAAVVVGLALVVISGFLEWAGRNFAPAGREQSFGGLDVPAKFLIDSEANLDGSGLPLGVLVIVIGVVGLVGALAPIRGRDLVVWVCGGLGVVIPLLYLYQLNEYMDRVNEVFPPGGFGARNTVGFGAALCGFGAVLALAGAALGLYVRRGARDR